MEGYVSITLNFEGTDIKLDLRIPRSMTLKELLQTVSESYELNINVLNPVARIMQTGDVLNSTSRMEKIKDGMMMNVEEI